MMIDFPANLLARLRQAQHIAVLTGAGVSQESGVPTFRQAQTGLWAQYDPEQLATPAAFRRNPRLVWEWYEWRRALVAQASPNPGHVALAQLEQLVPRFTLITQNVDGLHARAGSRRVVALHGDLMQTKCFADGQSVESWSQTDDVPPRCPRCGGLLRPDVVWFGENLPTDALQTAVSAAAACDVFLSIGTSALVQPAASLPLTALEKGALLVEINPDITPLTRWADVVLTGRAGEVLPEMVKRMKDVG